MYSVEKNKLFLDNGSEIEFTYPVKKIVEHNDVIIILIEQPTGVIYNRNVYAYDVRGVFLWQVENREYPGGTLDCPFIDIFIKDNKLILYNWCSVAMIVDNLTGKIISEYEHR